MVAAVADRSGSVGPSAFFFNYFIFIFIFRSSRSLPPQSHSVLEAVFWVVPETDEHDG